ncbi:uncharacterized protein LOC123554206 [Mercenaria mercenaria]|uniref:uncharacterized protein LOC123554206 n=1 Tax=Mercenaria mercenaria TaxID=6596 RepID=UPI00234EA6C1|nr:uncharacterized protein LOC123554206 [Mercenaria mercenaria]
MKAVLILSFTVCCIIFRGVTCYQHDIYDSHEKEKAPTSDIKEYINKIVSELVEQHSNDMKALKHKVDSQENKIKNLEKDALVHKSVISELENRIETLEATRMGNNGKENKQNTSEQHTNFTSKTFNSKFEPASTQNVKPEIRRRVRRANVESPTAFSASITSDQEHLGQGQDITFDHVITNVGGAYNNHHGSFIAPVSGTYVFYFSLHSPGARADLMVNGTAIANLYIGNDQASQQVIVTLKAGDDVSVQNIQSDKLYWGSGYSTFSGFLLYEGMDVNQIVG